MAILQVLLYAIVYWVFAPNFRYAIGPDFISYSAIAEKYASGDLSGAVNTWWSPAYSWLLAAGSLFTKDVLLANKMVQFLAGFPALLLLRRIIFLHSPLKKDWYAEWLLLAFIPALAWWALTADTPDLWAAVALLWFFGQVLRLTVQFSVKTAVFAGIAGAVAYWFKSYNFWFVAFFGLAILVHELFVRREKRNSIQQWLLVAIIFLAGALLWVGAMYSRTQQFTISGIGWHQPCTNEYVLKQKPIAAAADCAPLQLAATNRYSNWETPQTYPVMPISAYLREKGMGAVLQQNINDFFSAFTSRYQLLVLVLLVVFSWWYWRKWLFYYVAFWGIYCAGYWLFHLEARFFIMPSVLLMLGIVISYLRLAETITGKWLHTAGILVLMVLFAHSYLFNLWKFDSHTVPRRVHQFVQQQKVEPNKNIAAAAGL
ncbi:MAG: hypothetical protein JNM68_01265, partial [Dinghuibacter sp.]|nr:hypothetical protein [Dinghuibacter sp.]